MPNPNNAVPDEGIEVVLRWPAEAEKTYRFVLSAQEQAAYRAAHRILTEDLGAADLVCPGAQRSRRLDRMVEIMMEEMK